MLVRTGALLVAVLGALTAVWADAPAVRARAAVLIDADTGQVLYAKNAHMRLPPASLTKIMTAILVLERCDLDATVKASRRATLVEPSSMHLREGEQVKVRDLLYALMLRSANDAAVALAEHVAGSVEAFAQQMNQKARALGAKNTHFVNPHGLHHPQHLSTAYDLALITRYAMQNETFRAIVKTPFYIVERSHNQDDLWMVNKAKFLYLYPYAEGVKTGYTRQAGFCFAGSAIRDGRRLISVVLDSKQREADTIALMEHGFNDWVRIDLAEGTLVGTLRVENGEPEQLTVRLAQPLRWAVPKAERPRYHWAVVANPPTPPVQLGAVVGTLVLYRDGRPLLKLPVVAAHEVVPRSKLASLSGWILGGGLLTVIWRWQRRRRLMRSYIRVQRKPYRA
ncbi:MAG: D-alanyl-D-alanine carboxypeptidase [Fimbriimonadales bacterium]|nr:D-alanyl-D-alanine carboxypeptidase [Fimbriimonadales bacterium]MDW8052655.1 D-alanyl-D-alanine carboxypeptidase family protein [Armatimonadota bacterium]